MLIYTFILVYYKFQFHFYEQKFLQNSIDVLNFNENCLHFVTQLQSRN